MVFASLGLLTTKRLRPLTPLLLVALAGCTTPSDSANLDAGEAPPLTLVQENCHKAQAILQGKVLSVRVDGPAFGSVLLRVGQVYRGPFQPADTLRYYSFRSEKYDPAIVGKSFLVFLTSRQAGGQTSWGTATDLAEFPANAATETLLRQQLN